MLEVVLRIGNAIREAQLIKFPECLEILRFVIAHVKAGHRKILLEPARHVPRAAKTGLIDVFGGNWGRYETETHWATVRIPSLWVAQAFRPAFCISTNWL